MKHFSDETRKKISMAKTKHGQAANGGSRLYAVWCGMKTRATNPHNVEHAKYYVLRGISICDEWKRYIPFQEWALRNGYKDNLFIDRINNDLSYSPDNCRFVSREVNMRNSRVTKINTDKVIEIKTLLARGMKRSEVARSLGYKWNLVSDIYTGRTWKDVVLDA